MKHLFFLMLVSITLPSFAQIGFKQLIDDVNWQGTEQELITKFRNNIKKTEHEEWADENSCSDYTFLDVRLGEFAINQAPIRVDMTSKKLFRVNFIVYEDSKDASLCKKVDEELVRFYGAPIAIENDEGLGIISTYHKEWITNKYKVRSNMYVFGGDTYLYTISVEPIIYLPVDYKQAAVSINNYAISVPKIISFKVDNDWNVYIMKEGIEVRKSYIESNDTQMSKVIIFDGGIIGYNSSEVVYMKEGFAAIYPIIKNKNYE